MFEKVNPSHPDKIADRIAGAIVDLAYKLNDKPKIAVEILIGHGICHAIIETDVDIDIDDIEKAIERISGLTKSSIFIVPQDKELAKNQYNKIRCGDNGIFKGRPATTEQNVLARLSRMWYEKYPTDGKYVLDLKNEKLVICQSYAEADDLKKLHPNAIINPLGYWTGGLDVDTGATNRKLGSDMGDAVTGGGLHGKDLSKADVAVNIYAHLKAQETNEVVELCCAIGDEYIDGKPYSEIVKIAKGYIDSIGGFEKLAEWGLV